MLKHLQEETPSVNLPIAQVSFPEPFGAGLSYSVLSCGGWPLVQVGMLVPEAHLIFVCPQNCLRGVVLVAAEMHQSQRFSTIAVRDQDVIEGGLEELTVAGVSEVIDQLPKKPPAVLVYTNCIHHFVGTDLKVVYQQLRQKYPEIQFTDCYMNPIMSKPGHNPVVKMRQQLYSLLKPCTKEERSVNIIGNRFPMDPENDLFQLLLENGFHVHQVTDCQTYAEYQEMAQSRLNIITLPVASGAATLLADRLGQKTVNLPQTFDTTSIVAHLYELSDTLGVPRRDYKKAQEASNQALAKAQEMIGSTPIAISSTACFRPLNLARVLLEHGFQVTQIYADQFSPLEIKDFERLQKLAPNLQIYPMVQRNMRLAGRSSEKKTLAIGLEAAYFAGTNYFVDLIEGSGLYGFNGVAHLARLIEEAYARPKSSALLTQIENRGRGCLL